MTPETPKGAEREKDAAAVALGRKGGVVGGARRSAKLSPELRSEIARRAAEKRWHGEMRSSPKVRTREERLALFVKMYESARWERAQLCTVMRAIRPIIKMLEDERA